MSTDEGSGPEFDTEVRRPCRFPILPSIRTAEMRVAVCQPWQAVVRRCSSWGTLLPRTDEGALAQAFLAAGIYGVALAGAWRDRAWRTLVVGMATMTLAFFALRMLH